MSVASTIQARSTTPMREARLTISNTTPVMATPFAAGVAASAALVGAFAGGFAVGQALGKS